MSTVTSCKIVGTEAEIQSFIRSLEYEPDLVLVSSVPVERSTTMLDDEPFGASELIEVILNFAVAVGSRATYELIVKVFTKFRGERRHIQLEQIKDEGDQDTASVE